MTDPRDYYNHSYFDHPGLRNVPPHLRESFSSHSMRHLGDPRLSPKEWDIVMQSRLEALLQPYKRELQHKDATIARLESQLAPYRARERQEQVQRNIEKFLAVGKDGPILLLDGSQSMASSYKRGSTSPLNATLDALKKTSVGRILLWGDRNPVAIDPQDEVAVNKIRSGLQSGTDLVPALEMMAATKGAKHLVIVSDGDLFDQKASTVLLEKILNQTDIKVDLIIVQHESRTTVMEAFIAGLSVADQSRRPQVLICDADEAAVRKAIDGLTRTPPPRKAPVPRAKG